MSVLIYSGGLDSTTLLYLLKLEGPVYPITFNYGQRHGKEVDYALMNCYRLGIDLKVIDLSSIKQLLYKSSLTNTDIEVPQDGTKTQTLLKQTVVPFRNAIMLSIAVAYANTLGVNRVHYAAHASDFATYPDCRPNFIYSMAEAARYGTDNPGFDIVGDFAHMKKLDIVKLGSYAGVPFQDTWSCYVGGALHCGKCPSCFERKQAFNEAGVNDPTEYE